jgi:hypothetical protein
VKFITENNSVFNAVLTDQKLVGQLQELKTMTVPEFRCLRYILAQRGLDIWAFHVKESGEVNEDDVPAATFEYNVLDSDAVEGSFPMCLRVVQSQTDNSMVKLYNKIEEAYGLFEGPIFSVVQNPMKSMIESMTSDEDALGTVSTMKATVMNSMLDFLHKDVRVLTD